MPAAVIFVIVVTCVFAAVCISQMIMKPVKKARSDREWKQRKQERNLGMR